jgi:hypothetical protein
MNSVVVVFFLFSLSTYFSQLSIDKRVVAEDKYHEAKKIILREGAAFPAILCDALLIGKNRAERNLINWKEMELLVRKTKMVKEK